MDEAELEQLREASGLRLDAEGRWLHQGQPIEHARTLQKLHEGLHRAKGGRWATRLGRDWGYVQVDDAAYFARALNVNGDTSITAELIDGRSVPLDPARFAMGANDALYARLPDGETCKLTRAAQLSLAPYLREREGRFELQLGERRYPIAPRG